MKKLEAPSRPCDYVSKRGVEYWWSPEFLRKVNGSVGRVRPIKNKKGDVDLMMESKDGNLTFIQGSIQREFKQWHLDRQIDYILLGEEPEEMLKVERDDGM